jgi:hypothetical protein
MSVERTLSIIKPDAVAKNVIGQIIARFEKAGLQVIAARMMHLSREDAGLPTALTPMPFTARTHRKRLRTKLLFSFLK